MAITFLVPHAISLVDAKYAKDQESVYVLIRISRVIHQAQIRFMGLMEELYLLQVTGVVEVLPLVLLPPHVQVLPRHEAHAVGVVELVSILLQVQGVVCHHGLHITIVREINVLIVVATPATCTTNALRVMYPVIKDAISFYQESRTINVVPDTD